MTRGAGELDANLFSRVKLIEAAFAQLLCNRRRIKMNFQKKEMRIEKEKAIRFFLKSSKASGMKFTTLPDELSPVPLDLPPTGRAGS